MPTLGPLSAADPNAVEALLDAAFGADRRTRTAYKLRSGVDPVQSLSLAAHGEAGRLVGTLQTWPIELVPSQGAAEPLLLVGPVAVLPAAQGQGVGRMLMEQMLARADAAGAPPLMLIGDPEYYGRFFGFDASPTAGWQLPGPVERHRLLARIGGARHLSREGVIRPRLVARAAA